MIKVLKKIIKNEIEILVIYGLLHILITVANFGLYYFFCKYFELYYMFSNVLAYFIATIASGIINQKFVFRETGNILMKLVQYMLLKAINGILSTVVLYILVDVLNVNQYIAFYIVTVVFFLASFYFSKIIFKTEKRGEDDINEN